MTKPSENVKETTANNEDASREAETNDQVTASAHIAENQNELPVVTESNTRTFASSTNVETSRVQTRMDCPHDRVGGYERYESGSDPDSYCSYQPIVKILDIVTSCTTVPAPELYVDEQDEEKDVMLGGLWIDRRALEGGSIVQKYACDWWLPDGNPIKWTGKWCWRMQFAFVDEYYVINHHRSRVKERGKFARQVSNGISRLRSHVATTGSDRFCYRTHGEIEYITALSGIPSNVIDVWEGFNTATREAWV